MPGGPIVIIIDPDNPENTKVMSDFGAQETANHMRSIADALACGSICVTDEAEDDRS